MMGGTVRRGTLDPRVLVRLDEPRELGALVIRECRPVCGAFASQCFYGDVHANGVAVLVMMGLRSPVDIRGHVAVVRRVQARAST